MIDPQHIFDAAFIGLSAVAGSSAAWLYARSKGAQSVTKLLCECGGAVCIGVLIFAIYNYQNWPLSGVCAGSWGLGYVGPKGVPMVLKAIGQKAGLKFDDKDGAVS